MQAFRIVLLSFVFALCHEPVHGEELKLLTDEYPPISFSRDGEAQGLGAEVVREIQRRVGDEAPIMVLPWSRAYVSLRNERNVGLFATMRTPEREHQFKWVGPLTNARTSFYALRSNAQPIATLADARKSNAILVPRDYYSATFLRAKGFRNLTEANSPEAMARMLLAGRAQLMAADNQTLPTLLERIGAPPDAVVPVFTFMSSQSYIAFSRSTSDDVVQAWQVALDAMKRDGSFAAIHRFWLPNEAPPGLKSVADFAADQ